MSLVAASETGPGGIMPSNTSWPNNRIRAHSEISSAWQLNRLLLVRV